MDENHMEDEADFDPPKSEHLQHLTICLVGLCQKTFLRFWSGISRWTNRPWSSQRKVLEAFG